MKYEVEQKHAVEDAAALLAQLAQRGITLEPPIIQSDQYFAHPSRNFAKTDEALRIRTSGDRSLLTYKGPKIDAATKTRHELELPLHLDDADGTRFAEFLTALGFKPVATVRKKRRKFYVERDGRSVEGSLDDVDGIGTFVELELMANDESLEECKRVVQELAGELQLGPSERRSYLELQLAKNDS
jgi:adenylate cyclase, class 2